MNAAAKAINQGNFFSAQWTNVRISKEFFCILTLLLLVLLSSLAVVYTTNAQRMRYSQLQTLNQEAQNLQLEYGQLLLEQASLATSARIEKLAVTKLHMSIPRDKEINMLSTR